MTLLTFVFVRVVLNFEHSALPLALVLLKFRGLQPNPPYVLFYLHALRYLLPSAIFLSHILFREGLCLSCCNVYTGI